MLEGVAGIGKTTLWAAGVVEARGRGLAVLEARPVEREARLSFAGVADLMRDVVEEVLPELPAPQRDALAVALLLERPEGAPPEPRAVAAALVSALRVLARVRGVVVAVDDIQWLDTPSVAALAFSLRRLRSEAVGFLLAQRRGTAADLLDLDRPPGSERVERVAVGPLSLAALQHLLRVRLAVNLPRPMLRRVHDTSRGNPLFALELARALTEAGRGFAAGEQLPVPEDVRALVRGRLAALPSTTQAALLIAALLPRPDVSRLQAVLGAGVRVALAPAQDADVMELHGDELRFAHPLFASGLLETVGATRRREAHAQLAAVARDAEERAQHLALATEVPDSAVAAQLDVAVRTVAARGAVTAAAELAEQARRLTPRDCVEEAGRRTVYAGWLCFVAGDGPRARRLLEQAADEAPPGPVRALALTRLARLLHYSVDRREAESVYRAALKAAGGDDAIRAEAHGGLAWCVLMRREDVRLAAHHARSAVELYEQAGDPVGLADALSAQAQAEFLQGGGLPSAAIERALTVGAEVDDLRASRRPAMHHALLLLCADELDAARARYREVHDWALRHGDESTVPWLLMRLAQLELLAGDWARAASYADEGLDLAVQARQPLLEVDLLCARALVAAHRGDVETARAAAADGGARADRLGAGIGARITPWALGLLELSLGDPAAAHRHLAPLQRATEAAGIVDPGEQRYLGDLMEALVALGRLDEADALADELERRGTRLARASAVALAARGRGRAAAARGDTQAALEALERALVGHRQARIPFETARTELAMGSVQRRVRHKRAARASLQSGLDTFERLGASLWAKRARDELDRLGGRPASSGGLTPTEQQVAAHVVNGLTNREVAAALFVTDRTVEYHLTHIYAKLGVRSRAELAARSHPQA
jgi:DNA-binding CsgD family transcriptional regulator